MAAAMPHALMENIPAKPLINFTPSSPWVEKIVREGQEIEKHYYLHPKLKDCYRYKYRLGDTVWWIDVNLAGDSIEVWRLDGSCWFEGKIASAAGLDDEDED